MLATIIQAIEAVTSAIGLFDKISDQIEEFLTKRKKRAEEKEHRRKIFKEGNAIVNQENGQNFQVITAEQMQHLPKEQLKHIQVFEKSMKNHYGIWERTYPQLALIDDPVQKAKVELQLNNHLRDMKNDLEGILTFLEDAGFYLDDHYLHVRDLIRKL